MRIFAAHNKTKLLKVATFVCFLSILFFVFSRITYLFRNFGFYERNHVVGIKNEESNIDAVYIGGSASFVYWQPIKAYKDCGFTSYDLATRSICMEGILPLMKYAQKYQDPKLFVIGVRAFEYFSSEQSEQSIRHISDSMDLTSLPRYELISTYLKDRDYGVGTDYASYYLDIAKYHGNYENLAAPKAWGFINNTGISPCRGYEVSRVWSYVEEPEDFRTDERRELLPAAKEELDKIIEYCDKEGINAVFVVCPYAITKEHYATYNTISDIVTSHGYGYLNANDHYDEIGLDFSRDCYNSSHVNASGAEKYTAYLEKYLTENYDLPDHRGDRAYSEWDEAIMDFDDNIGQAKESIDNMIADSDKAIELGSEIRIQERFPDWSLYVKDYRYSLLVSGDGTKLKNCSDIDRKTFEYLGFNADDLFASDIIMDVLADPIQGVEVPDAVEGSITVDVGHGRADCKSEVVIDNTGKKNSIKIEGEEYSRMEPDGLNIVVFENYYRTVIDSVTLKNIGGNIVVERQ